MDFAINGFGRIGRAIFRLAFQRHENTCIIINEPKATTVDMCYFLKYDSLYGTLDANIIAEGNDGFTIKNENHMLRVRTYHYEDVDELLKEIPINCAIIDASGLEDNIEKYNREIVKHRVIYTMSSSKISQEIILGVNDNQISTGESLISGSICDTIAIAPVLKAVYSLIGHGYTLITTMHPALSYQRVIDNYIDVNQNRSLGRQYIDSIIPKRTSAEEILNRFFSFENSSIRCLSYRIPTESVCSADITIFSDREIAIDDLVKEFGKSKYLRFSSEDLVSIDFKASNASAVIDLRWTEVINKKIIKIVIWYDNEYGYSSRILDLLEKMYNGYNS